MTTGRRARGGWLPPIVLIALAACAQAPVAGPTATPAIPATPAAPAVPVRVPSHRAPTTAPAPEPEPEPPVVRLAFAGDSYAEGPLEYRLATEPRDFVGPFADVLRSADVAMLNLETAITTATTTEPKAFNFATTSAILPALAAGGVDVVSMANNHGMDFGYPGLDDSLRAKRRAARDPDQPTVIGIGGAEESAYAPAVEEVDGQRIAFFTASQVLDPHLEAKWTAGPDKPGLASAFQLDTLVSRIRETRPQVDTVVAFLHWGIETTTCPIADQIKLTRRLKAAGADIVVGGGAHRIAGGGMMGRAAVHYGLGNFMFQAASAESDRTGVFLVDIKGRHVVRTKWLPGRIVAGVPQRLAGSEKRSELAYWESLRTCTGGLAAGPGF